MTQTIKMAGVAGRAQRFGFWQTLARMQAVAGQRRALSELPDERLQDLGLSRTEAETEAARPVWDVPGWWR